MTELIRRSRLERIGCWMSDKTSALAAHPYSQVGLLLFCAGWFGVGWGVDLLTAGLSILAITLTQMVLNRQEVREAEAHRRDLAVHAKLDELIIATREARDEIAGIEELEAEDIEALRDAANVTPLPRPAARKAARA
ncbi:MAG TPA: low affinity iron permease family protein [Allosphingosinicella sp.]